jgi:hypothetical protein
MDVLSAFFASFRYRSDDDKIHDSQQDLIYPFAPADSFQMLDLPKLCAPPDKGGKFLYRRDCRRQRGIGERAGDHFRNNESRICLLRQTHPVRFCPPPNFITLMDLSMSSDFRSEKMKFDEITARTRRLPCPSRKLHNKLAKNKHHQVTPILGRYINLSKRIWLHKFASKSIRHSKLSTDVFRLR